MSSSNIYQNRIKIQNNVNLFNNSLLVAHNVSGAKVYFLLEFPQDYISTVSRLLSPKDKKAENF